MTSPFEGRLIRLRAREPEDEPQLYQWFNDPEVTEWLTVRYPVSHQQERDFLAANGAPGYHNANFAIVTKTEGTLIGGIDLGPVRAESREGMLGIAIGDKAYWDGGYGTDAMRTLCGFGFDEMNLHRIQLEVFAGNERAIHVYEKVGFQREGLKRDGIFKRGRYHDIVVMSLLEGELRPE